MSTHTELYELLEVSPKATDEEIKKAYRRKALQHHPDKGGDAELFKKINFAYETLSNHEKRSLYDQGGTQGLENAGQMPPDLASMFGNMFGNMEGLDGLFNMFQNHANRKSPPIVHQINVSLEDLCRRKIKKLKFNRERICECCDNDKIPVCGKCKGQGVLLKMIRFPGMIQQLQQKCTECKGHGKIYSSCEKCTEGVFQDSKIFEIHLTPELENGYKYTFKGEGNQQHGLEPGDFIVIIVYESHEHFALKDKNLIYTATVSLKEALCGYQLSITHPSGEIITANTDTVITPETVITIKNKGLGYNSDLEVHFKIKFPETLSEEQKEILSKHF